MTLNQFLIFLVIGVAIALRSQIEAAADRVQNEGSSLEPMTLNQFLIFLVMGIALAVLTSATWIWWILAICTTLVVIKLLKK